MAVPVPRSRQISPAQGFKGNGLAYLLLDTFDDARAAGLVNGTYAQPGPGGARTVTDTNSKLSIAGGVLSFATGAVADTDGVTWPIITRTLGRIFLATVIPSNTNGSNRWGWSATGASQPAQGIVFWTSGTLYDQQANQIIGVYTAAPHSVCVIMRTAGTFVFIKGDAFASWTLLYANTVTAGNMYPRVSVTGGSVVCTADNIRVPAQLFIPMPLASDGFSGATTDGAGHAEANGGGGLTWTGATWTVASGAVTNTPTQGSELLTDGGLENWASATDLTSWTETLGGTGTVNREATTIRSGTYAAREDTDASGNNTLIAQQITASIGAWLSANVWLRTNASGKLGTVFASGATQGSFDPGTSFTNFVVTWRNTATNPSPQFQGVAGSRASASYYWDDLSIKPLTLSTLFRSLTALVADVIADVAVTLTAGTQAGLVVNLDSAATPANFIIAYHDGTNCHLDECVAGTYTSKINAAATYSAGAVLRVIRSGTEARLFYNSVAIGTVQTLTANTNTLHGLFSTYSSNSLDNLTLWARGTGGEYAALDQF